MDIDYAGNGTMAVRLDDANFLICLKQYNSLRKFQRNLNPAGFLFRRKSFIVMIAIPIKHIVQ